MSLAISVDIEVSESGRKRPEYTLESDLNGEVSLIDFLQFTKSALIVTADTVLREEQSKGFDEKPVTVVDGSQRKSPALVNPLGQIEFVSRVQSLDIVLEAYLALVRRSPVLTGEYKRSHFVFLNGKQVATDENALKSWIAKSPEINPKDLVRIVNVMPYARKLERYGVTADRTKTRTSKSTDKRSGKTHTRFLQPNGTYFLTTRAMKAKYKRNTSIRFSFIAGATLGIQKDPKYGGTFKKGRPGKNSAGRSYLYPTITFYFQEGGTL